MQVEKLLILAIVELVLSMMSFYIIYRSEDRAANAIYFLTGASCFCYALSYLTGHQEFLSRSLWLEHYFIQAAILARFITLNGLGVVNAAWAHFVSWTSGPPPQTPAPIRSSHPSHHAAPHPPGAAARTTAIRAAQRKH